MKLLIIILVVLVGVAGWYLYQRTEGTMDVMRLFKESVVDFSRYQQGPCKLALEDISLNQMAPQYTEAQRYFIYTGSKKFDVQIQNEEDLRMELLHKNFQEICSNNGGEITGNEVFNRMPADIMENK